MVITLQQKVAWYIGTIYQYTSFGAMAEQPRDTARPHALAPKIELLKYHYFRFRSNKVQNVITLHFVSECHQMYVSTSVHSWGSANLVVNGESSGAVEDRW